MKVSITRILKLKVMKKIGMESTLVNTTRVKGMAKVNLLGTMVRCLMESGSRVKRMDWEHGNLPKEITMREIGLTIGKVGMVIMFI